VSWYEQPGPSPGPPVAYPEQQPPVPAPAPQSPERRPSFSSLLPPPEFWVAAAGVILLLAGSVAPWATIAAGTFSRDVSGLRGNGPGVLTLVIGVTSGVLLCVWLFERGVALPAVAAIVACAAGVVAIVHVADPGLGSTIPPSLDVEPAWGAWAVLAGSVLLGAGAAAMAVRTGTRAQSASHRPS
jgi:hypothetical protein